MTLAIQRRRDSADLASGRLDGYAEALLRDRLAQPAPEEPRAALPVETRLWRTFYDSYEKGTVFIGPDVDTIIAGMLDPTEAEKIVEAHNAPLAASPIQAGAEEGL